MGCLGAQLALTMKLPRLTGTAFCALASLLIASLGWAQDSSKLQRTAVGILNDAHKNEGKELVLDCAYVEREDHSDIIRLAKAQGLSVFYAADENNDRIPILLRLGDENALTKQFGTTMERLPNSSNIRTRKLRGIVTSWNEPSLTRFLYYLRYEGAKQWVNSADRRQGGADNVPQKQKVAFDDSPMRSFSYDSKRLNEARVVDVGAEGVVVASEDSISVTVPLDRAIKMPDLRMRAKDAMEAALSTDIDQ